MKPETTFNCNNLNELQIEKIQQQATLGNVRVNLADCSYLISANKAGNLQINLSTAGSISNQSVTKLEQLAELLNIKQDNPDVSDSTAKVHSYFEDLNLPITSNNNFFILASDKLKSIEQATKLLADTQQQIQKMEDKFKYARKQGGAYASAILTDKDLLKQHQLAKRLIVDTKTKLEIETNQLTTIQQLYERHAINIDSNDTETQKSAYDFACAECHSLEQQLLMEEVAELSEKIVAQAQQSNAAIVFPGRSLIACAAYIERNYPNVKLIKMPLSGVAKKATLTDSDLVNKKFNYVNNFLNQVPKDKNLLIVDYVNSAESLAVVKKISNGFYQDKTTCIAIYSKYSIIKSNEEFQKSESILKNTSFDAFFQAGNDQYSPLANALHKSTFDGVAPYGKHEITKKTEDQTEPYRSEDGFNLLKDSFN